MLHIDDVRKAFGGVQALKGVSLTLMSGEVVALLGENGAGKSTLVGVASGRLTPDSGSVAVDGQPLAGAGPAAASALGVRLVPQELMLCRDMTVLDNVLLGARPRRFGVLLSRRQARSQAQRRLDGLGVQGLDLDAETGSLSVVDQAFVQIARSFTPDARVLLIDEPTAPMDSREVDRFLSVLQSLKRQGVAIVYISHRLDEVFRVADRIAVMRDGLMVAQLSGSDMNRARVVAEMTGSSDLQAPNRHAAATGEDAVLDVAGLTGGLVQDFTVRLSRQEIACVYGISGSGREEVGSLVVGARRRRGGSVRVNGHPIRRGSIAVAVAAGLGYVPAERRTQGLALDASVAANLTVSILRTLSRSGFLRPGVTTRIARTWIARLTIRTPGPATPIGALSGGSQQKVMLARWLAAKSTVLVLEEPTRGVDVATKAEIYAVLHALLADGKSVLVITSDIEEATVVADRVLVMRGGTVADVLHRPTQSELALAAQGAMEDHHDPD